MVRDGLHRGRKQQPSSWPPAKNCVTDAQKLYDMYINQDTAMSLLNAMVRSHGSCRMLHELALTGAHLLRPAVNHCRAEQCACGLSCCSLAAAPRLLPLLQLHLRAGAPA